MLHAKHLSYHFWAEVMNTACHVHNRFTLRTGTATTLYELWKERKPAVKYFHIFGSKCYILADRDYKRKMDPKSDEGIFLGYSTNSRACRVYNNRTQVDMESINVVIDDAAKEPVPEVVPGVKAYPEISTQEKEIPETVIEPETNPKEVKLNNARTSKGQSIRVQKNHPQELIIGDPDQGIRTRRTNDIVSNSCFVSKFEPKNVKEALTDIFGLRLCKKNLTSSKEVRYGI